METEKMIKVPNPSTMSAKLQGCTCPEAENTYGLGVNGDGEQHGWVICENCQLHGKLGYKQAHRQNQGE